MKGRFHMPSIELDRSHPWPLRQQIFRQIAGAIRAGEVPCGARLPASRLLAKVLGVSRNTVVEAYERLLEADLLATKAGSGVVVKRVAAGALPNIASLRRTARAAHYPGRTIEFEDPDGLAAYLNVGN